MTDLMTYLRNAFDKHVEETKLKLAGNDDTIGTFTDFCKKHLKGNPPVSVFTSIGLGLRLADGTEVTMVEPPSEEEAVPDSIPVTRPRSLPGQCGITDTRSVPVFGGK